MSGPIGLAGRLFAVQVLVVLTGSVTLGLVAATVGPAIFHDHLRQAAGQVSSEDAKHVELAYASASALTTGVGLLAALVAAMVGSALIARRVAGPIGALGGAAADLADGNYAIRVAPPGLGREFDLLAEAFNTMAERLEAVETTRRRLLADLGHEMRTPLATIEAYLDAAEDGVAVDDEDTLTVLRTQTARLRRLTEDLATVSLAEERQFDLHRVPVSPSELVRAAIAAAQPRYTAKGVILAADLAPGVATVNADPERLGQVLSNLLDNALRHTPSGGRVTVAAAQDPTGVRLVVADTGEGIPVEHLPHVFERFYRADSARDRDHGGSGIGLAVVRAIAHAHGGGVTAASAGPGRGAVFAIILPAAPPPPAAERRPAGG